MRCDNVSALRLLLLILPRTKHRASRIFDLPEPLGPSMMLKLSPKTSSVCLANDLNPLSTILFILVIHFLLFFQKSGIMHGLYKFWCSVVKYALQNYSVIISKTKFFICTFFNGS